MQREPNSACDGRWNLGSGPVMNGQPRVRCASASTGMRGSRGRTGKNVILRARMIHTDETDLRGPEPDRLRVARRFRRPPSCPRSLILLPSLFAQRLHGAKVLLLLNHVKRPDHLDLCIQVFRYPSLLTRQQQFTLICHTHALVLGLVSYPRHLPPFVDSCGTTKEAIVYSRARMPSSAADGSSSIYSTYTG
jgi:hypothetical protein